jgi:hypothetical protein
MIRAGLIDDGEIALRIILLNACYTIKYINLMNFSCIALAKVIIGLIDGSYAANGKALLDVGCFIIAVYLVDCLLPPCVILASANQESSCTTSALLSSPV